MNMTLLASISEKIDNEQNENASLPSQPEANKFYKQNHTLADMSLGRIRRRALPFRRPFSL